MDSDLNKTKQQLAGELALQRTRTAELERALAEQVEQTERNRLASVILDAMPMRVSYVDDLEKYQFANKTFEEWFGHPRSEVPGTKMAEHLSQADYDDIRGYVAAALEGHQLVFQYRQGTAYFETNYLPDFGPDGKVRGFASVTRDITGRWMTERHLRQYEHIVSNSSDLLALLDREYVYQAVNPAHAKMFGLTPEEMLGKTAAEVFGNEIFNTAIKPNVERCLRGEEVHLQSWFDAPDLGRRCWDIHYSPHRSEQDKIVGFIVNARDITESRQAEEALKKSERRLKDAQEMAKVGYWELSSDDNIVRFSEEAGLLIGRNPADGSRPGDTSLLLSRRGRKSDLSRNITRAIDNGETYQYDVQFDVPGMGKRWHANSVRGVDFVNGVATRVFGTVQDITERKQVEAALKESEERFSKLFRSNPGIMIITTLADGRIIDVNDTFLASFGYNRDEIIGRSTIEIGLWHQPKSRPALIRRLKKSGGVKNEELVFRTSSGEPLTVLTSIEVTVLEGEPCLIISGMDITERQRTVEELQESEARLRSYIDHSPDAIFIVDATGHFIDTSRSACEMLGHPRQELLGMAVPQVVPPENTEDFAKQFHTLSKTKVSMDMDRLLLRKDGSTVQVNLKVVALPGNRFMAFCRDISERKHMEEQAQQAQLLASLGEMTAGIAHEVNNPLAAILLYSELLDMTKLPPATRKDLGVIRSEARRASGIMRDLLTYSRKAGPITRRIDIRQTLKKVIEMRKYQAQVRNIEVDVQLPNGPVKVLGNAAQLTQVFMNLIINAEEAVAETEAKRIVISVKAARNRVRISVEDSGIGIPEEHLSQVFVPFFSTKSVGKGTGLGLATCHGIVTAHGGLIHARNNDSGGTTFTVELALARPVKER